MPANATASPAAHQLERCTACGHVVQRNDFCGCRTTLLADEMAPRVPIAATETYTYCDTHRCEWGFDECTAGRNCYPVQEERPLSEVTEPDEQPRLVGEDS